MILSQSVLYFPYIDITESDWLKTALLIWDEINTIVPDSFDRPYRNRETQILHEYGILKPIYVTPSIVHVEQSSKEFLHILNQLKTRGFFRKTYLKNTPNDSLYNLYTEKMTPELHFELISRYDAQQVSDREVKVDRRLGEIYMALLASIIARQNDKALWADKMEYWLVADQFRRGDLNKRRLPSSRMNQASLAQFSLRSVRILADTSIENLIKFREKHDTERRRFRTEINKLSAILQQDYESNDEFLAHCHRIYEDHIDLGLTELRKSLDSQKISNALGVLSLFAVAQHMDLLPQVDPAISLATAAIAGGIAATWQYANYRHENIEMLRKEPLGYVLHAEERFGKRKR